MVSLLYGLQFSSRNHEAALQNLPSHPILKLSGAKNTLKLEMYFHLTLKIKIQLHFMGLNSASLTLKDCSKISIAVKTVFRVCFPR